MVLSEEQVARRLPDESRAMSCCGCHGGSGQRARAVHVGVRDVEGSHSICEGFGVALQNLEGLLVIVEDECPKVQVLVVVPLLKVGLDQNATSVR